MKVMMKNVRLAFPALYKARSFAGGEGESSDAAFSASAIFSAKHPAAAAINEAIDKVGSEKWKDKWASVKKQLLAKDAICLHDGDTKEQYAGFAGNLYVSARNKAAPGVFDIDKSDLTERSGKPYGGCYVNMQVDVWAQDNAYGKRVNATLLGVQFIKDGEAFGAGAPSSADDFEDESENESLV